MTSLTPRSILVTGSASGIGLAIAERFAADGGIRLLLADRSEAIHDVARRLSASGCEAEGYVVDLAQEAQVLALAEHTRTRFGGCDVLVNNAGMHPKKEGGSYKLPDIPTADWELVLRVNLTAPFLLCRELVPLMKPKGWGRVVNIASRAGRTYIPQAGVHYAASKAGLIALTRQIAGDYARFGIAANAVAPGRIETPLSNQTAPEIIAKSLEGIPARRVGTVAEIAATAHFLASDGAGYINGACIDANGGVFMA
ncbi:MAG TPA: SDR family NAD(P)-dependent oxidoreductase [Burkholderiaceae bacterium]|jgi:3-oxoacyl-[acyl-carrier protein] reductase